MNMHLTVVERTGYTLLDVLSDVGGLQGILISGLALFLSIVNHSNLETYLVSKTFKFEAAVLKTSQTENIKNAFIGILPKCMICCKKSRKHAAMDKAREELQKEVDIIEIIQSRRYFKLALKQLLEPQLQRKLE